MYAYDELQVAYITENQGELFLCVRDELPGVDEKWFIEEWMKSKTRSYLDKAYSKWAGMMPEELLWWFIDNEKNGKYKKGDTWGGFMPQWIGIMYSLYQWKYSVPSKQIIEELPLSMMEQAFVPFHQASDEVATEKLREMVLKKIAPK